MPTRPPIHRTLGAKAERLVRMRDEQQRKDDYSAARRARGGRSPYNGQWSAIRLAHLMAHPLCVFHMEQSMRVPANEVDHIDGNAWNNAPDNHRSLCKSCHSKHTARQQGFARRWA